MNGYVTVGELLEWLNEQSPNVPVYIETLEGKWTVDWVDGGSDQVIIGTEIEEPE